jgi:hypothetical protein
MGGSPSIPSPPPAPNPAETAEATAQAYSKFYANALNTYISRLPDIVKTETDLRVKYQPTQRALERQLSALDQLASVQAGLQIERQYGGQRTLESLRRQYELSPQAFAINRAMGNQMVKQFARLYGEQPYGAVPLNVAFAPTEKPLDYIGTIGTSLNPQIGA